MTHFTLFHFAHVSPTFPFLASAPLPILQSPNSQRAQSHSQKANQEAY